MSSSQNSDTHVVNPEEDSAPSFGSKEKNVDLREISLLGNKQPRAYELNDKEIKIVTISNDIVAKFIENDKGYFVDFRKYYKGYPTKKGIRITASKFIEASEVLRKDIEEVLPAKKKK